MSKQLDKFAALNSVTAQNNTQEDDKTHKNRVKAAIEWVQHYVYVAKIRQEAIDLGVKPEDFTTEVAVELMVEQWEATAATKATTAI